MVIRPLPSFPSRGAKQERKTNARPAANGTKYHVRRFIKILPFIKKYITFSRKITSPLENQ
jgi:hypothetical protein